MSLVVLMYHHAAAGPDGNSPEMLDAHFAYVRSRCNNVLPGEPLADGKVNVCLSFDDAYLDFYHTAFILLKRHRLRALLAVPPASIGEQTSSASPDPHCSWPHLEEMASSGQVKFAAHGYSHVRVDQPKIDFGVEIHAPKTVLGARLEQPIDSFVFPYGRFSRQALAEAKRSYRHLFRIGGASNIGWHAKLLYRVCADEMTSPSELLHPRRLATYRARRWWNCLRRR